jgi:hypothetical protein
MDSRSTRGPSRNLVREAGFITRLARTRNHEPARKQQNRFVVHLEAGKETAWKIQRQETCKQGQH